VCFFLPACHSDDAADAWLPSGVLVRARDHIAARVHKQPDQSQCSFLRLWRKSDFLSLVRGPGSAEVYRQIGAPAGLCPQGCRCHHFPPSESNATFPLSSVLPNKLAPSANGTKSGSCHQTVPKPPSLKRLQRIHDCHPPDCLATLQHPF